ncbi:RDD family protein [Nocardiopsis sp. MT53]|uniref:RDD family protein n=2 Tax=Nocardiopsidaceae TaxID=83676 RepID=A0ABX8BKJ0_9ACTN|nr:RDD family protein [Nocardiopsis changdeensis]QYX37961.1 RDD family protein [Nocardiopsis sp. MT53]
MSSPYWNPQGPGHGGPPPQGGPGPGVPTPHGPQGGWMPHEPEPVPAGPERASFGRRLAARFIDYILAAIAATAFFILMAVVMVALTGVTESSDAEGTVWALLFFFGWGVLLFFYDWLFLVTWGATLGKLMLGIKVTRADGGRLTQGQAVGRSAFFCLPQSLPCLGHVLSLMESMAALGEDRLALHDRVSKTVVVHSHP